MGKNYFLIFGIFLIIFLALFANLGIINLCQQEYLREEPSPGGNYKAVLFIEDCGMTTNFSTKIAVLLRRVNKRYWNDNNIVLAIDGWREVQMIWTGPKSLRIGRPPSDVIFVQKKKFKDISIEYN